MGRRIKNNLRLSSSIAISIIALSSLIVIAGCYDGMLDDIQQKIEEDRIEAGTAPTYTVTYEGNENTGGEVPVDLTNYTEGEIVTVLGNVNNLVRDGFTFLHWNTEADDSGTICTVGPSLIMSDFDITLYAIWTELSTWTVTFDSQGGSSVAPQNVIEGGTATTPAEPTRSGYTFGGWFKEELCLNPWDFIYDTVIANISLYAKWTVNNYTITFNKNDAGATGTMSNQTIASGSSANLHACTFTKTGWTFAGWATTAGGSVAYTDQASYTMGTSNVTLYAKWTINQYTVTYNGNGNTGGSVPSSSNHDYNSTVTVADNTGSLIKINVSDTSYRFAGWNTQANGNGYDYVAGSTFPMPANDVTLYAKWIAYTLRDTGPAGGLIFHDKGYYSLGWRYLEAAPVNQMSRVWGMYNVVTGADGTAIGTGEQNTIYIIDGDLYANKAADECDSYSIVNTGFTYDDWFLPSKDELNLMYVNLHQYGVGGFASARYWSSSEYNSDDAWSQHFFNGSQQNYYKFYYECVRAVRAF